MSALLAPTSTSLPPASDNWPHGLRSPALLFGRTGLGQDAGSSPSIGSLTIVWSEPDPSGPYYHNPHEGSDDDDTYALLSDFGQYSLSIARAQHERSFLDANVLAKRALLRIFFDFDASTGPTELESDRRRISINRLSAVGRTEAAEKLTELMFLIDEDPDEPDLDADSLMYFADFLIDEPNFETPVIGIDPEGRVQAEWPVLSQGLLVLNFRQDGLVRFVAASGPARLGKERMRVSGTLRKRDALRAVEPFRK